MRVVIPKWNMRYCRMFVRNGDFQYNHAMDQERRNSFPEAYMF